MIIVLLLFDFVDHVDKFLKQATPLAPPTTDDSSSSHQPQMSATEKKQLLMQYGCASDDEDEREAIETSNKGTINKIQFKATINKHRRKTPPSSIFRTLLCIIFYRGHDTPQCIEQLKSSKCPQ